MDQTVSVIIPTYNRHEFLAKAVTSVLSQTWKHIDLIVVDDGSTDGTAEMLGDQFPAAVRYIYQQNNEHGSTPCLNGMAFVRLF